MLHLFITITDSLHMTPYILGNRYRHFREICLLHLQGILKMKEALKMEAAISYETLVKSTRLHGVTSQNTVTFIVTPA
jgi:hypothetical protein